MKKIIGHLTFFFIFFFNQAAGAGEKLNEKYIVLGVIVGEQLSSKVGIAVIRDNKTNNTAVLRVGDLLPFDNRFIVKKVLKNKVIIASDDESITLNYKFAETKKEPVSSDMVQTDANESSVTASENQVSVQSERLQKPKITDPSAVDDGAPSRNESVLKGRKMEFYKKQFIDAVSSDMEQMSEVADPAQEDGINPEEENEPAIDETADEGIVEATEED